MNTKQQQDLYDIHIISLNHVDVCSIIKYWYEKSVVSLIQVVQYALHLAIIQAPRYAL